MTTFNVTNLNLPSTVNNAEPAQTLKQQASLKKSCQEFEAIFLQSMFKAMRKTVPESGLFDKNSATEIYEDMMDQEVAVTVSRQQSLGLAKQMYHQMVKNLPPLK